MEPLAPPPPGHQHGRAIYIGEGERPPRQPAPPLSRFLELIPVKEADQPVPFGGRVQILGIERYDSKVAVAWRLAPLPDPELQFAQELSEHEHDTEGLPARAPDDAPPVPTDSTDQGESWDSLMMLAPNTTVWVAGPVVAATNTPGALSSLQPFPRLLRR